MVEGFLLRDVRRYSGLGGGAETVFVAVLVVVGSVACFWFVFVRAGSICATVPPFLSYEFGIWYMVGRVFGSVQVSALVVRELRGAFIEKIV